MAVVVMQCMTLVMTVTTRRKTRFLTGVTISPNKAKPTTATTAFCLYLHPLIVKANRGKKHGNSPTSTTIYSVVARTKLYHTTHPIISPITKRNSPDWHSRPLGRVREGCVHKQQQRCRCCVSPAQGCGRKHATLGTRPPPSWQRCKCCA